MPALLSQSEKLLVCYFQLPCVFSASQASRPTAAQHQRWDGAARFMMFNAKTCCCAHTSFSPGSELGPQQRRIVTLEAQLEALHSHLATLEAELAARASATAGSAASAGDALVRTQAAEARAAALEAEAENLARQVALLQERLGRGEYNPATTRVLHFRHNPEAEVQRELRDTRIAELEAENGALREHLQRLEAATEAAAGQAATAAQLQQQHEVCVGGVAASRALLVLPGPVSAEAAGRERACLPCRAPAAQPEAVPPPPPQQQHTPAHRPPPAAAACDWRSWKGRPPC